MEKYQSPSLSMIPLYRSEGDPTRAVMDWKQAGIRIERALMQDGFNVKVFILEEKEEQVIFGIIVSEDRFSMPYYKEVFEKVLENLAERDNFTLNPSPDGTRAFYLSLNKEQVEALELRTALESHEILASPSRLTVPVGRAFSDTVESLDLRFFSCFYMMDDREYTPGLTDVLLTGFLFRTNPKDVRFLFLDLGHVLEPYYDLPHMFDPPTRTMSGCLQVIRWIQDEIILRLGKMEAKGARSLDGYNASLRVDEQAYTRLLVFITPADELFDNQDFLTVLRMVREHGLMVGIHFFMQMNTPVPVTFLTKTTLCFKRAIDAETPKHRLVKNYQIKRGEHTPHFVNACYTEQSDIDTITKFLKENNKLKYMGLVKVQEEEATESAASDEQGEEEKKDDVLMFSFGDSTEPAAEAETPAEPVSESPAAQWALPEQMIHIPKGTGAVSKEPLRELRRRKVAGYISRFERIARSGNHNRRTYRSAKRLRKSTVYRSESILRRYENLKGNTAETQRNVPTGVAAGYAEPTGNQPATARIQQETVQPDTPPVQAEKGTSDVPVTAEDRSAESATPDKKTPLKKAGKPVIPVLLGGLLLLGGTYAILRQNNIVPSVASYIPFLSRTVSGGEEEKPTAVPALTAAPTPMVSDTAAPEPTSAPGSTSVPTVLGPAQTTETGTNTAATNAPAGSETDGTKGSETSASAAPTQMPANTVSITAVPSATNEPVVAATLAPETGSTETPVKKATKAPTQVPTATPVKTAIPSGTPTAVPTVTPTQAPTATPGKVVSMTARTKAPTTAPTVAPTATPTLAPTWTPTVVPTATPTRTPTWTPTVVPTLAPTPVWTGTPTQTPTLAPTQAPTTVPTAVPTTVPTETLVGVDATETKSADAAVTPEATVKAQAAAPAVSDDSQQKDSAPGADSLRLPIDNLSGTDAVSNKGVASTDLSETGNLTDEERADSAGIAQNTAQNASDALMSRIPEGFREKYAVGDKGEDVILIKKRMMEMGYYSGSTFFNDRYNGYMAEHVRTLQKLNGLPVTGEIGVPELILLFAEPENK